MDRTFINVILGAVEVLVLLAGILFVLAGLSGGEGATGTLIEGIACLILAGVFDFVRRKNKKR